MSIPHAQLARPSVRRRLLGWLADRVSPPTSLRHSEGFAAASYWSLTGALAAGCAVGVYVLCVSGTIWDASVPLTVGWAIFSVFGAIFWFWPFLASYYMYRPLTRFAVLGTRVGAAAYGALWHASAHYLLLDYLGSEPLSFALSCPILVGGVWGSWLPAVGDQRLY